MGEIVKALFNKVRYVNDQGKKSKAYKNIDETFNSRLAKHKGI